MQGARQVERTMPDAVRIFIAPPSEETLRERLDGSRHRRPRADRGAGSQVAKAELAAQGDFPHVVHNDDLATAADELERVVRSAL